MKDSEARQIGVARIGPVARLPINAHGNVSQGAAEEAAAVAEGMLADVPTSVKNQLVRQGATIDLVARGLKLTDVPRLRKYRGKVIYGSTARVNFRDAAGVCSSGGAEPPVAPSSSSTCPRRSSTSSAIS